jgi:O-antigen/teichoic acid export membrane protein
MPALRGPDSAEHAASAEARASQEVASGAAAPQLATDDAATLLVKHETRRDLSVALRNALKLGSSLMATWAVGLIVSFAVPRALGPARFGILYYAESLTGAIFVVCGFGIDTYIQKVVSIRPKHASDFFGTTLLLRTLLSAVVLVGIFFYQRAGSSTAETIAAVMMYGLTQVLLTLNNSLSALLQSATKVGRLAISNVLSKFLWGGGVLTALHFHAAVWVVIVPLFATELLKACVLWYVVRREIDLELTLNVAATRAVLKESRPFFVNTAAFTVGSMLDGAMMKHLATADELGYYGGAKRIAALALLLSPLVSWILTPLLTRARARSDDEFFGVLRRAMEAVLVGAIPATMLLSVGADIWIHILYGRAYDPAVASLRVLAPSFVLTYVAVLLSTALILFDRAWPVTLVSIGSLALQPFLITFMVPFGARHFGAGGAGLGNAMVFSFLELFSVLGFAFYLGRRAVDGRCLYAVFGSLFAFAAVAVLDRYIQSLGPARIAVDAVAYTVLIFATGAVRVRDVRAVLRLAVERRKARAEAA